MFQKVGGKGMREIEIKGAREREKKERKRAR
jgi:hypothetical protein